MKHNLAVREGRVADDLRALAAITEPDRPYTRRAFTPMFLEGRAYLRERFVEAGLSVSVDAAGNLIGRREGRVPGAKAILIGSHSDTVPDGGRYDGVAGVVAALEVARALADQGIALDHALEVVDFLAEEVSVFGVSCIGSRGLTGARPHEWLDRESGERSLAAGIAEVGGDPAVSGGRSDIAAFLELHIEQGPVLESEDLDIGVVTTIAGISRVEIVLEGQPDHAGTTPMDRRRDALAAAAILVQQIEAMAREMARGPAHFAATVGEFEIAPNAANVVPARVRMLVDIRAEVEADLIDFVARLDSEAAEIARTRKVGIAKFSRISHNPPTPMDAEVMMAFGAGCDAVDARHRRMASGAGHDAAWLAKVTKAGMIFIPCAGGRSHTPDEHAETSDVALGAAVLMEAVIRLDASFGG